MQFLFDALLSKSRPQDSSTVPAEMFKVKSCMLLPRFSSALFPCLCALNPPPASSCSVYSIATLRVYSIISGWYVHNSFALQVSFLVCSLFAHPSSFIPLIIVSAASTFSLFSPSFSRLPWIGVPLYSVRYSPFPISTISTFPVLWRRTVSVAGRVLG